MSLRSPAALVAGAVAVALVGIAVVVGSYAQAGAGDRPLPRVALPDQGGCVADAIPGLPQYQECADEFPSELRAEYRAAWIGLALFLAGAVLLLAVLGLRSVSRRAAYVSLAAVAGAALLAALSIFASSLELDFVGGDSAVPRLADAFERVAKLLLLAGVLVVPAGAIMRRFRPASAMSRPART